MPKKSKTNIFRHLPDYLQPRILSAVAFINSAQPDLEKAIERINTVSKSLSSKRLELIILSFDALSHVLTNCLIVSISSSEKLGSSSKILIFSFVKRK